MKLLQSALGPNRDQIDGFFPGKTREYSIEPGVPFSFPPAADFPDGGLFLIRIPAGAVVAIRDADDGDGYVFDPGHWRQGFLDADSHVFTSDDGADIAVIQYREV